MRGYEKDRQRAIIQNFNLTILMVTMAVYLLAGNVTAEMLPRVAVVAPAMLIPALIGARVYHRIDEARFRAIVLTLLTVS
ncbi:sulfite exporter TauE/SafE family protein, partial [Acinetobacter baumannii]